MKKQEIPTLKANPEVVKLMKNTLVIKIDGGLWRVIAMSGAITEKAKQQPVKVITSRPLAFRWNPYIKSIHWLWDRRLFQDVIRGNDYIELEPYTNPKFFNEWVNWLEIVREQLWLDKIYFPEMYLAEREKKAYKLQWRPILFQPFGSTMDINRWIKQERLYCLYLWEWKTTRT